MSSPCIDLNCDMGEGFGAYAMGRDRELLDFVSSANVACGFHAGDAPTMRRVVGQAIERGVKVGAHPGLPDLQGFGRRVMQVSPADVYAMVVYQVGALSAFAKSAGGALSHVKAHGALYNMAARDSALASAIARAVFDIDPQLVLFGLAGSEMVKAGQAAGLQVAQEVFADRSYQQDGSLTPRGQPGAMIENVPDAVAQVLQMVQSGTVCCPGGQTVPVQADTLCIHGDHEGALDFAREIRTRLEGAGISVRAPSIETRRH